MKKSLTILAFVLLSAPMLAQIPPLRVGDKFQVAWDYTTIDIDAGKVTAFEVSLDSTTVWTDSGLPVLPAGTYVYVNPTPATLGKHVFRVRACAAPATDGTKECSLPAQLSFLVEALIKPPTNLKIEKITETVSLNQTIQMFNSYVYLQTLEQPTDVQLFTLARQYDGPIPSTREDILNFLELTFPTLVIP